MACPRGTALPAQHPMHPAAASSWTAPIRRRFCDPLAAIHQILPDPTALPRSLSGVTHGTGLSHDTPFHARQA